MSNDRLKTLTTTQLYAAFKTAFNRTADGLRQMADIWVELLDRGENLDAYRNPMLSFLPDVASGKLLPEVLLRYGSNVTVLGVLSGLVPEDQRKLAQPDARVAVRQHDGTVRSARPTDLRQVELRQVFGEGRIRTPDEQRTAMAPAPRAVTPRQEPVRSEETDLWAAMNDGQRARIVAHAEALGMSPAAFILDHLIRFKVVPGRPLQRAA